MAKAPKLIRIQHDDYLASLVGKTKNGRQFFITQPFVPRGRDFVARYVFDKAGAFLEARIEDLGVRKSKTLPGNALDGDPRVTALQAEMLKELGEVKLGNIKVAPFSYQHKGIAFGLIPQEPEDDDDDWSVIAEPGDYMAFYPPWDGEYDT